MRIGNAIIKARPSQTSIRLSVAKADASDVLNAEVIVSCFVLLNGFDICQTSQEVLELRDIAEGLVLGSNKFQYKDLDYPTQEGNHNELDQKAFALQRDRKTQQLAIGLYRIVCVECNGFSGIFTFLGSE